MGILVFMCDSFCCSVCAEAVLTLGSRVLHDCLIAAALSKIAAVGDDVL